MKILYIPLDERPGNYRGLASNLANIKEVELVIVPSIYMGHMKESADIDGMYHWMEEHIYECDAAVISFEMLMYGGFLPSRVHKLAEEPHERLERFKKLAADVKRKTDIDIYLFANIMNTTPYASSEDDPDSYRNYGDLLYQRAYLLDKKKDNNLCCEEEKELANAEKLLPQAAIKSYESRRNINLTTLIDSISMLKNKTVDCMAVVNSELSTYGYAAREDRAYLNALKAQRVDDKVIKYTQSNEMGFILICRAIAVRKKNKLKVAIIMDRVGNAKLSNHEETIIQTLIGLAGVAYSNNVDDCDIILFMHSSKNESADTTDVVYNDMLGLNKPFVVWDTVNENVSDPDFVRAMLIHHVSDNLLAYSSSHTIGIALSLGIVQYLYGTKRLRDEVLFRSLAREYAFNTIVRPKYDALLKDKSAGHLTHINSNDEELKRRILDDIMKVMNDLNTPFDFTIKGLEFTWYRLNEIKLVL